MMAVAWLIPALVLASGEIRRSSTAEEQVDLIELNHFYDDQGRHVYDQVIFYEWSPWAKEFHVRAWCLIASKEGHNGQPWRTHHDKHWHVEWFDKDHRLLRAIESKHFRETWTQVDPERANNKKLDQKLRTALVTKPLKTELDNRLNR